MSPFAEHHHPHAGPAVRCGLVSNGDVDAAAKVHAAGNGIRFAITRFVTTLALVALSTAVIFLLM